MTDNNHPILPTQEQLTEWDSERFDEGENFDVMMIKAFQAGADQELEACCEWLHWQNLATHQDLIPLLRATRRPKPPSLKEQALDDLHIAFDTGCFSERQADTIRHALESLPDV